MKITQNPSKNKKIMEKKKACVGPGAGEPDIDIAVQGTKKTCPCKFVVNELRC